MNNKTGYGLRIVLGGYLAYLGIRMLIQTVNDRPANMVFMGVMAVLFAVVGIAYAVYSLKKVWEMRKEETKSSEAEKNGADEEPKEIADAAEEKTSGEDSDETSDVTAEEKTEEIENDYEEK